MNNSSRLPTMNGPHARGVGSIFSNLMLMLMVFALLAFVAFEYLGSVLSTRAQNDFLAIADAKRDQIERMLSERIGDSQVLAQRTSVFQTLQAGRVLTTTPPNTQSLGKVFNQMAESYGYHDIRLLDRKLNVLAAIEEEPNSPEELAVFRRVIDTRQMQMVDIHFSGENEPAVGIAQPVFQNGEATQPVIGLVYLEIDLKGQVYPNLIHLPMEEKSAESLLLRRKNDQVTYLSPLRYESRSDVSLVQRPINARDSVAARALEVKDATLVEGRDYRGVKVIAAVVPIEGTNWVLEIKADKEEIDAPVQHLGIGILVGTLLLSGMTSVGAWLMWRAKQSELNLIQQALNARYTAARQASLDGYMVYDENATIIDVNERTERMTGYTRDELIGKTIGQINRHLSHDQILNVIRNIRKNGAERLRTRWQTKDGHLIDVEISASYMPDPLGDTYHSFAHDIGAQLAAQHRIEKLNRFYHFLSHANASIFKLRSMNEILDTVCREAVTDGGFELGWVGLLDEAAGRVWPSFVYGDAEQYVQHLVITTDPGLPTSRGPARLSMVEQRLIHTDDFQADPRTVAWHAMARQHNLRANVSLPIIVSGKSIGVINFYSSEQYYFDAELRALIEELGRNVSLALQAIEARDQQQHAAEALIASETRYRQLFETAPTPTMVFSLQTRQIQSINQAYKRVFGYDLDEMHDQAHWFALAFPDKAIRAKHQEHYECDILRAVEGGPGAVIYAPTDITLRCRDGRELVCLGSLSVAGDDLVVQWQDLTKIRRSEELLAESEQSLTGMYVTQDDRIVYVNQRFLSITGHSESELLGRPSLDSIGYDAAARTLILEGRSRLLSGENSVALTLPFQTKDGTRIELGIHGSYVRWQGRQAVVVLAQDITERKRAEDRIAAYVKQLEGTMRGTLQAVANMVDLRDPYTSGHERRVGIIAADIAREMGWDEQRCNNLELIGLVHDIGKIGVPAEILSKPTRLTPLEYEIIKGHAQQGYEILKDVEFPLPIAEIIREHHERLDGSGYPQGLKGEAILPEARVLAVADVLESMASHRPYRPALGIELAVKEIESHRGLWFDEAVVDAVLRLIRDKSYQLPA